MFPLYPFNPFIPIGQRNQIKLIDAVVYKYDSPYQDKDVLEKELMYIIEIKNED